MMLKIRSLAFILTVIMLFSGAVHGKEVTGIYGKPVQDQKTTNGIYYGLGYNPSTPNLLIGGISQESQNPDLNSVNGVFYRTVADNNKAIYVPTYYTGDEYTDAVEVNKAAYSPQSDDSESYSPITDPTRTIQNGLRSPALNNKDYGTIIAYSGGTASVMRAIAEQGVTADTLILISPMRGGGENLDWIPSTWSGSENPTFKNDDWAIWFEQRIQKIFDQGTNIVVIQSPRDDPKFGGLYQYRFTKKEWPDVAIYDVDLDSTGVNAHREIFTDYATQIVNGKFDPPTPKPKSNSLQEFAQLLNPRLPRPTSDEYLKYVPPEVNPPIVELPLGPDGLPCV